MVAGDTGIDFLAAVVGCFIYPFGIRQHGSGHGDHIGLTVGQNVLGNIGHINAVRGNNRNVDDGFYCSGSFTKRSAGNGGNDGWNTCFVPAYAGVNQGGAGGFYLAREV